MTRGDIPCHLFKKTFQSSTSPPDSPLFFPCTPQNLPLSPISASPVIRSSIFLPFSPFSSRPAGESPPTPRGPVLISLFIASGGRIPHRPDAGLSLSHFLPRPAGESPPARRGPVLISLFAASGGNILRPKCRAPAEQLSAASGKNGHNKNRKPSGSRLFSVLSKSGYTARGSARDSDNRSPSSSKMRSTCASAAMCSRWICRSEYPMCSAASAQVKLHW